MTIEIDKAAESAGAPPLTQSLRERVLKSGSWILVGYGASQVLRFGGNLLLTRLLFPEAFGIMAIVQAVLVGVSMVTDLGISQGIVLHAHDRHISYINTAWTVQIVKGVLLALGMTACGIPAARMYGNPMLATLVPAMGLVAFIGGFLSTKVALADRNVDAGRVTIIEVGSFAIGLVAMVLLALRDPSPWALLWGNVVTAAIKVVASHWWLKGPSNRLAWDRAAVRKIASFGGWVMLSSAVTYLVGEGSRLAAGTLLDLKMLGLFGLASTLSLIVWASMQQLSARVLFPAYSEVIRTDPSRFREVLDRSRKLQIAPAWAASAAMAFLGPFIIHFLYDKRYADAGALLQVQSLGLMVGVLSGSYGGVLWAMGRVGMSTTLLAVQAVMQLGSMFIGHRVAGAFGVVVGWSFSAWLFYPVAVFTYRRLGLWYPKVDAVVLAASIVCTVLVFALLPVRF